MRRKISLLVVLYMGLLSSLLAQDPALPAVIPSSPEAFSLCQAGLLSNSLYTGTATLSVPLYSLALKSYALNVQLQYASSGIKNSDVPTIVGMNFNLLAGGSIVRIVHDEPDGSYENTPTLPLPNWYNKDYTLLHYLNQAADNYWDTEPDEYLFNINGMSGRFFVDSSGNGHCIPESNLKIVVTGYDDDYKSFTITTVDGTVYTFNGVAETTDNFAVAYAHSYSGYFRNETAWFLTNITTQTGEWINFYYTSKTTKDAPGLYSFSSTSSGGGGCGSCAMTPVSNYNVVNHDTYQLSYITSSVGARIDVAYEQRPDYAASGGYATGDYRVTGVTVSENVTGTSHTLKQYVFKYSASYTTMLNTSRYYLDTVVSKALDGSSLTQKYVFDYIHADQAPNPYFYYTFDIFGYAASPGFGTPAYPVNYGRIDTAATRLYYQGKGYSNDGYSIPNPAYAPLGMLEKVTFPTGGYQKFYYEPNVITGGIIAGGERVSKIENYDPLSGTSSKKYYKYTSLADTTVSSGTSSFQPFYDYSYMYGYVCGTVLYTCNSTLTTSNSLTPYGSFSGSYVNYNSVIESDDSSMANGGIEHTYRNDPDYTYGNPYLGNQYMPTPAHSEADMNGAETKTVFFKNSNGALVTLKKVVNTFATDKRNQAIINGYMNRRRYRWPTEDYYPNYWEFDGYDVIGYQFKTYRYNLTKTVITSYDEKGTNPVADSVLYEYKDSLTWLPTKVTRKASDTATIITYNNYPAQLASGTDINYQMAYNRNMRGVLVESKTYRQGNLVAAQKTVFNNNFGGSIALPEQVQTKMLPDTTNYKTRVHFYGYGSGGAPTEMSKENDVHQCYIYDYGITGAMDNFPIAEVTNAAIGTVAYTSFEASGKGGWTFSGTPQANPASVTGGRCYNLASGSITKTISSGTTYTVTFWLKTGSGTVTVNSSTPTLLVTKNGWSLYSGTISSASTATLAGTGTIDELRLYPLGAQMRTMTYRPFIGISSECDINNRITYYDYDGFGRLLLVRDDDKNVLKKNCYTYNGQTENCTIYGNVQKSALFKRNSCGVGLWLADSAVYTVAANTYFASSQAYADSLATADMNINGQQYINATGSCTRLYQNMATSSGFTRNNCSAGYVGSYVVYQVPCCVYFSTISDADANNKAVTEVLTNGQAYANSHGTCTLPPPPGITLNYHNYSYNYQNITIKFTNNTTHVAYTFTIPAYSNIDDVLGTLPATAAYYTVLITNPDYSYHTYQLGCSSYSYGYSPLTIYNVYVSSSCTDVYIDY